MDKRFEELYTECTDLFAKYKSIKDVEKRCEKILVLIKKFEDGEIYLKSRKLYRLYVDMLYEIFEDGPKSPCRHETGRKVIYHIEQYLREDRYNFRMIDLYITTAELMCSYRLAYDKLLELLDDPSFREYAVDRLGSSAFSYYTDGVLTREEVEYYQNQSDKLKGRFMLPFSAL